MNILLIPDKFKGSLSAAEVVSALKKGILKYNSTYNLSEVLISDGGDGFLEAMKMNDDIHLLKVTTTDSLGREIPSFYGFDSEKKEAYIELAIASGLSLLTKNERSVLNTSTYGTGIQIQDAIKAGATKIFVGLGGSATNDGGIGIAAAMGYKFLERNGNILKPIGSNLNDIAKVELPDVSYDSIAFFAVNDVENVLFGSEGAAYTYGYQKGADDDAVEILDQGLRNLHEVVFNQFGKNCAYISGAGAAGGAAFGLKVFFNAQFISGINFILDRNGIDANYLNKNIDLIITGEGKIDSQTKYGKVIKGIAEMAKKSNVPVVALCGLNTLEPLDKESLGLKEIVEIADKSKPLDYSLNNAARLVEAKISNYFNKNYS